MLSSGISINLACFTLHRSCVGSCSCSRLIARPHVLSRWQYSTALFLLLRLSRSFRSLSQGVLRDLEEGDRMWMTFTADHSAHTPSVWPVKRVCIDFWWLQKKFFHPRLRGGLTYGQKLNYLEGSLTTCHLGLTWLLCYISWLQRRCPTQDLCKVRPTRLTDITVDSPD